MSSDLLSLLPCWIPSVCKPWLNRSISLHLIRWTFLVHMLYLSCLLYLYVLYLFYQKLSFVIYLFANLFSFLFLSLFLFHYLFFIVCWLPRSLNLHKFVRWSFFRPIDLFRCLGTMAILESRVFLYMNEDHYIWMKIIIGNWTKSIPGLWFEGFYNVMMIVVNLVNVIFQAMKPIYAFRGSNNEEDMQHIW